MRPVSRLQIMTRQFGRPITGFAKVERKVTTGYEPFYQKASEVVNLTYVIKRLRKISQSVPFVVYLDLQFANTSPLLKLDHRRSRVPAQTQPYR